MNINEPILCAIITILAISSIPVESHAENKCKDELTYIEPTFDYKSIKRVFIEDFVALPGTNFGRLNNKIIKIGHDAKSALTRILLNDRIFKVSTSAEKADAIITGTINADVGQEQIGWDEMRGGPIYEQYGNLIGPKITLELKSVGSNDLLAQYTGDLHTYQNDPLPVMKFGGVKQSGESWNCHFKLQCTIDTFVYNKMLPHKVYRRKCK